MLDTHGKKILVVDDEEVMRSFLSDILADAGYNVQVAATGGEALELVQKLQPNLIILDIVMPDMSGDKVAAILRENPSTAKIPIIFLSGIITKQEEEVIGKETSKQCLLAKPIERKDLLEMVRKVLPSKEQYYKAMASEYFAGLKEGRKQKPKTRKTSFRGHPYP